MFVCVYIKIRNSELLFKSAALRKKRDSSIGQEEHLDYPPL